MKTTINLIALEATPVPNTIRYKNTVNAQACVVTVTPAPFTVGPE